MDIIYTFFKNFLSNKLGKNNSLFNLHFYDLNALSLAEMMLFIFYIFILIQSINFMKDKNSFHFLIDYKLYIFIII